MKSSDAYVLVMFIGMAMVILFIVSGVGANSLAPSPPPTNESQIESQLTAQTNQVTQQETFLEWIFFSFVAFGAALIAVGHSDKTMNRLRGLVHTPRYHFPPGSTATVSVSLVRNASSVFVHSDRVVTCAYCGTRSGKSEKNRCLSCGAPL